MHLPKKILMYWIGWQDLWKSLYSCRALLPGPFCRVGSTCQPCRANYKGQQPSCKTMILLQETSRCDAKIVHTAGSMDTFMPIFQ